jgi:hypothetical protein
MSYLPKTVITGLLASLFVALVINPTLCAAFMRVKPERRLAGGARPTSRFMRAYERLLAFSIDHHRGSIVVVFAALAALVALYGAFGKGLIFFPEIEPDRGNVNIQAPRHLAATTDLPPGGPRRRAAAQRGLRHRRRHRGRGSSRGRFPRADARMTVNLRVREARLPASATSRGSRRTLAAIVGGRSRSPRRSTGR